MNPVNKEREFYKIQYQRDTLRNILKFLSQHLEEQHNHLFIILLGLFFKIKH